MKAEIKGKGEAEKKKGVGRKWKEKKAERGERNGKMEGRKEGEKKGEGGK